MKWRWLASVVVLFCVGHLNGRMGDLLQPTAPVLQTPLYASNRIVLTFTPGDAVTRYRMEHAGSPLEAFQADDSGLFSGFTWQGAADSSLSAYFRLQADVLPTNRIAAVNLLNRIGYGPTPDELDRIAQIGTAAYLAEQLAPETILQDLDTLPDLQGAWQKVTFTGPGAGASLYLYLEGQGDAYVDDVRLVAGSVDDGTQNNLVQNSGFESVLQGTWTTTTNYIASARSGNPVHSGAACLHLVAGSGKNGGANSVSQKLASALKTTAVYTLSFWYLPSDQAVRLDVRMSANGPGQSVALNNPADSPARYYSVLTNNTATLDQLRSWHLRHAIQSRRQLLEVMRQFWENHFVTQNSKSQDYMDGRLPTSEAITQAVNFEFRENLAWRNAMLKPETTFNDLLKISAESPAMIIYLDTALSRGDIVNKKQNIANENFGRELCELFTFGVDNGYDQGDIVQISRAWTGWRVDILAPGFENDPFSGQSKVNKPGVTTNFSAITNLLGTWSFRYIPARHDNRVKYVFFEKDTNGNVLTNQSKHVPARFGPPWAGQPYGLVLDSGSGTNSIQDGYQLLRHMASQPFTEEFLSVKLCRLFVHENFNIGYDFTDGETSPEEELVHACMMAWENPPNGGPKGQLRPILKTIFDSALFRAYTSTGAKVKTPLEFIASTVRALRAARPDGSYTAYTDAGADFVASLARMGGMALFNRAEPNGYPEDGGAWISAGTLADRIRFVESALMTPAMTGRTTEAGANIRIDPVGLLRLKIPGTLTDPAAVADYLLGLICPAEGAANLAGYRDTAVQYLNTTLDGKTASPYDQLSPDSTEYDTRLRGLTALLLASQRFQEQ
ncbi:MAG TPA: DUF1800 family protein [Candidatus Limnocylindria bacterium]|nr:DUF1800 family protein [Candidatus Limnocylindria bacterium]